ncbi:hypothetical protein D3C71_1341590 [compost metagenome]
MQSHDGIILLRWCEWRQIVRLLREDKRAFALHIHQLRGDALDFAVFDQPLDELCPRVIFFFIVIFEIFEFDDRRFGEQQLALDGEQSRGHHQKLAGYFQLQFLHGLKILHILLGDLADRNVLDVDFRLVDQMQQ